MLTLSPPKAQVPIKKLTLETFSNSDLLHAHGHHSLHKTQFLVSCPHSNFPIHPALNHQQRRYRSQNFKKIGLIEYPVLLHLPKKNTSSVKCGGQFYSIGRS